MINLNSNMNLCEQSGGDGGSIIRTFEVRENDFSEKLAKEDTEEAKIVMMPEHGGNSYEQWQGQRPSWARASPDF